MCSRYSLTSPPEAVRSYFGAFVREEFPPRYNIAPTQPVHIVRNDHKGARELVLVRWGLIPSWVKQPKEFATLVNARSEGAGEKPSFRAALRHRRCLVPTDGFYEWTGEKGEKQPHLVRRKGGGLFAMAGLWEHWIGADGSEIETMAILTVAANSTIRPIHDRMPAIVVRDEFDFWLDTRSGKSDLAQAVLQPAPAGLLEIIPVSRRLNNSRNEGPDLLGPLPG